MEDASLLQEGLLFCGVRDPNVSAARAEVNKPLLLQSVAIPAASSRFGRIGNSFG